MKKLLPIFVSLILATAAILAAAFSANAADVLKPLGTGGLSITDTAIEGTDYDYVNNILTIKKDTQLTISGTTTSDRIVVDSAKGANITLSNVNIDAYLTGVAAFEISADTAGTVTVTLSGKSTLTSGQSYAGLQKTSNECELIIQGNAGGLADEEYNLEVTGGKDGAGIGGGTGHAGKNISIKGGKIKATSSSGGAGIGGGKGGNGSNITIENANLTVNAKYNSVAGDGAAAIGGGNGGSGSNITIGGTAYVDATGSYDAAAIGGGKGGSGTDITIKDTAIVIANGGFYGAGIGGGDGGDGTDITIKDEANVTSISRQFTYSYGDGAGIGGGNKGKGSDITISGDAIVNAQSAQGAGIGGGSEAEGSYITISGNADVTATGGISAGIGGGWHSNGDNINIENCKRVVATSGQGGAGIGGGQGDVQDGVQIGGNGSFIMISGGEVEVTGGGGAAGIGGGTAGNGSGISICDAKVTASSSGGAGIGGGAGGNAKDIKIYGKADIETTGYGGAGIGGGTVIGDALNAKGGAADNILIYGSAKVKANGYGGAAIGSGSPSAQGGCGKANNIKISENAYVEAICAGGNVGIGGFGDNGKNEGVIEISGGTVIASSVGGVGIGNATNSEVNITISGGDVTASGLATGIGSTINRGKIKVTGGVVKAFATRNDRYGILADTIEVDAGSVTANGGTDSGSGISCSTVTIKGADTVVNATGGTTGCGITGPDGASSEIWIIDGTVTATGGTGLGRAENQTGAMYIRIDGGTVSATADTGAAISCVGGNAAYDEEVWITGGTVIAEGGSNGIGSADGTPVTIRITGGTTAATGTIGIGGVGDTVYIKGASGTEYPWVFTNKITSANYVDRYGTNNDGYLGIVFEHTGGSTFTDKENNNFNEGIVYGTDKTVEITEDYTLTTGKKLTVPADVTFKTNDNFTLDGSVLYLKEGATLDKWYEMEKKNDGKIEHEDRSPYEWYNEETYGEYEWFEASSNTMNNETGVFLCDICGTPEPHNYDPTGDWEKNDTHHWHNGACNLGNDCSVNENEVKVCNYTVDGKFDYGKHRYDDPIKEDDGKLHFYCIDCNYERIMDIPVIRLVKVDGTTNEPLEGAEFGLYTNAGCTGEPYMTGITAIDTDNGTAVVSFNTDADDTTKYIKPNTTYYIKETKAPDGYRISNKVFMVVVDEDGNVTYGDVGAEITSATIPVCKNYVEEIASDPAKLIKVDGEGRPLTGAVFGIYSDAECTTLITTAITAIDTDTTSDTYNKAVVLFDTELNGTYYIKETKAPDGYKLSDKIFKVTVDENGKVTYGNDGSEEPPICENIANEPDDPTPDDPTPDDPTPDDPTPDDPTPDDPTPDDPTPDDNHNPNTGVGIGAAGLAGAAVLVDIIYAASKKRKANKK